jgi:hypothetical protein
MSRTSHFGSFLIHEGLPLVLQLDAELRHTRSFRFWRRPGRSFRVPESTASAEIEIAQPSHEKGFPTSIHRSLRTGAGGTWSSRVCPGRSCDLSGSRRVRRRRLTGRSDGSCRRHRPSRPCCSPTSSPRCSGRRSHAHGGLPRRRDRRARRTRFKRHSSPVAEPRAARPPRADAGSLRSGR